MAAKNKHTKKSTNFPVIITGLLSIVLVAIIVFGIFALVNDPQSKENDPTNTDTTTTDVKDELKNNTDDDQKPEEKNEQPTDTETTYDEQKAGYESEKNKDEVKRDDNGKKVATTSLSIVQADAFIILSGRVTNFKEEGGSCTYILKNGNTEKKYDKPVIPDAKNTVCEAVKLDKSEIGSGQWTVWVDYQSNNAKGTSETQTINL